MASGGQDLYETLEIRYPPTPAPRPPPRCATGTLLAVGTAVMLVLGTALAVLVALHVQGRAELWEARAELAAAGSSWLPNPSGPRGENPTAAQRRKDQLGQWLQGLSLGWRYHAGMIYYFSADRKGWEDAEAACRSTHGHLASVTSAHEQDYLAREARGGSYWIGLVSTGTEGTWRWVDGTSYSRAESFWAPGQPDGTDHGRWGRERCAQIHPVGNGLWNDHNCNFTFPWVCKRHLDAP